MPENIFKQVIEAEKATLKSDVRLLLHKLTTLIENGDSRHYQTLVSSIYNELDNYNLQDMLAWRNFIAENVDTIIASKTQSKAQSKILDVEVQENKQPIVAAVTNMKVIGDAAGNFYVTGVENGVEKIVFQTDDKTKAEEFTKQSAVASPVLADEEKPNDITNAEKTDELETNDFDSIPSEKAVKDDELTEDTEDSDALDTAEDEEAEEEKNLLDRYDEMIDDAHGFLDEISNVISEVPDLRPITELAQIKAEVTDILADLEQTKIDSNIITGNADKSDEDNLNNKLDESKKVLELLETKVLDVINKYDSGTENEVATNIENDVKESIAASKEVAADEDVTDVNVDEVNDVDESTETEPVEELEPDENTEPDEDLPAADDTNYNNVDAPSDDAPSDDEINETLDEFGEDDENIEDNSGEIFESGYFDKYLNKDKDSDESEDEDFEAEYDENNSDVESMINDLVGMVNVPGDKAKEFSKKVDDITSAIDDICAKAGINDINDSFNNHSQNDYNDFDENNEQNDEKTDDIEQLDEGIQNKISPKEDVTQPDLLDGIDDNHIKEDDEKSDSENNEH